MLRLVDTECKKWDAKEFVTAQHQRKRCVRKKRYKISLCEKGGLDRKIVLNITLPSLGMLHIVIFASLSTSTFGVDQPTFPLPPSYKPEEASIVRRLSREVSLTVAPLEQWTIVSAIVTVWAEQMC